MIKSDLLQYLSVCTSTVKKLKLVFGVIVDQFLELLVGLYKTYYVSFHIILVLIDVFTEWHNFYRLFVFLF